MSAFFSHLKNPFVSIPIGIAATVGGYYYIRDIQKGNLFSLDDQSAKTYIVTGATSGIGKELAAELAKKNAQVIMACRDRNKCLEVRRDIVLNSRNKKVFCRICDLSDMQSVHQFVQKLTKGNYHFEKIDGVVLNAATKCKKYSTNRDGIETSLATNHMGSFLLLGLLLQKMLNQEGESRIVFVGTDIAMKDGLELELDKLNAAKYTHKFLRSTEKLDTEKGKYDMHAAYKFSKLVQMVFARELAERLEGSNIRVIVADPGGASTNLDKNEPSQAFFLTRWCANIFGFITGNRKSPQDAMYPVLYAIVDNGVKNGTFVSSRRHLKEYWCENAENPKLRSLVWGMSEKWTNLSEHMNQMEEEIESPNYFSQGAEKVDPNKQTKPQRSAKYLWLA